MKIVLCVIMNVLHVSHYYTECSMCRRVMQLVASVYVYM